MVPLLQFDNIPLIVFTLIGVLLIIVWKFVRGKQDNNIIGKEIKLVNYHLPFCSDEVALIISYLEQSDIGTFSLVCREAKQASYSSRIWNEFCGPVSMQRIDGLLNSERFAGKITCLKLFTEQDDHFDDDFIYKLFVGLNEKFQIRKLTFEISTLELFKFNLLKHLDCLESLTYLKLLDTSTISILFNNHLMPIRLPKKLEYIKIRGFSRISNRTSVFESLFTQSENIQVVKFENNQAFNELKFKSDDVDLNQLTTISLSWTNNISTEQFNNLLAKCTNIKKVDLSGCTFVTNNLIIPRTVEILDISSCIFDDTTLTMIACLPHLKFVNLSSTLVPLDILTLYCKIGRCIICQIGSKEELQTLKSIKHVRLTRLSPLDIDSKMKQVKKHSSVEPNVCRLYYQQVFIDAIDPPKLTLKPTKVYKAKLVKFPSTEN